jgi:putative hemolysin
MWGFQLLIMLVMIVLNGIFAAYEIALASIFHSRLQALLAEKRRGARAALLMKQRIEGSLAAIQLGITLVGAIAAAVAGAGAQQSIAPYLVRNWHLSPLLSEVISVVLVVLPLTFVTMLFGELIPKVFALRNQELVVLRISTAMEWVAWCVWPLVWVLEWCVNVLVLWTERKWHKHLKEHDSKDGRELQELRASAQIARTSRLIGSRQERIILRAAELSQRPIEEIMLSAEFISLLNADSTMEEALVAAHLDMHTRFPVTEKPGDPQGIIGYVIFKDIISQLKFAPHEPSIRNIIRQIKSYPPETSLTTVLERLIRQRAHIALVREKSGRLLGMVTTEDLLEELVGDMEDEYDRLPRYLVPTGAGWIVGGGTSLQELKEQTGIDLNESRQGTSARTLSDWVSQELAGPIHSSEILMTGQARVLVRKCRRHKVMEAYLSLRASSATPGELHREQTPKASPRTDTQRPEDSTDHPA